MPHQFIISEYRIHGAHVLTEVEIGSAVYPFLGPMRTVEDIQAACAALEQVYRGKGYGAASVQYAPQLRKGGVVDLNVSEGTVARLRVRGQNISRLPRLKRRLPRWRRGM